MVKSDQVYKCSEMCRVRDYLLRCFSSNRTVVRREFVEKSKSTLSPEDIKQMLQQISTYDSASRVWEFCFPTDNDFLATHPSVKQFCAKKQRSSSTKRSDRRGALEGSSSSTSLPEPEHAAELSSEDRLLIQVLDIIFGKAGVCNLAFLKQVIQPQTEPGGRLVQLRGKPLEPLLLSALDHIADEMYGAYYRRVHKDTVVQQYREIILELFRDNRKLSKTQVFKGIESRELPAIPKGVYTTIMKELAYSKGVCWFFKSGSGGR